MLNKPPKSTPFPRISYNEPTPPQPPSQWSGIKRFGAPDKFVATTSCCLDSQDNIYFTGYTTGSFNGELLLSSYGRFVVKYDSGGALQWTKIFNVGEEVDSLVGRASIACDSNDNIYLLGISDGNFNGETAISPNHDVFLLKLDPSGNTIWTKLTGSTGSTWSGGVTINSLDEAVICGSFNGSLEGNPNLGSTCFFVKKYDSNGNQMLLKIDAISTAGTANTFAYAVKTDNLNNIYVSGTTTGAGLYGIFTNGGWLVKYTNSLVFQWASMAGSQLSAHDVEVDNVSDLSGSNTNIYIQQRGDGYKKYDSNGNLLLNNTPTTGINPFPSTGAASVDSLYNGLSLTNTNPPNIYVACDLGGNQGGLYTGNQNWYELDYTGYIKQSVSGSVRDGIISRYNSAINKAWTKGVGGVIAPTSNGSPTTNFYASCTDTLGNVYVCGTTKVIIDGTTPVGVTDGIILKYDSNGNLQ
jgi:hypothetical protein